MFDIIISKSKNKYCYNPRGYWAVETNFFCIVFMEFMEFMEFKESLCR